MGAISRSGGNLPPLLPPQPAQAVYQEAQVVYIQSGKIVEEAQAAYKKAEDAYKKHPNDFNEKDMLAKKKEVQTCEEEKSILKEKMLAKKKKVDDILYVDPMQAVLLGNLEKARAVYYGAVDALKKSPYSDDLLAAKIKAEGCLDQAQQAIYSRTQR